jgi:hypothetical protein
MRFYFTRRHVFNIMDASMDNQINRLQRHPITKANHYSMGTITFDDLEWTNYISTRPIDISMTGLGVESDQPIKPCLIWFNEHIRGNRCGVLVWCKQDGAKYRAGIQFIPLNQFQEDYFQQQIHHAQPNEQIQDPQRLVEALIIEIKGGRENLFTV